MNSDDNEGLTTSVDDPNPGAQTTATSTESSDFPHLLDGGQLRFEGSALTIPPDQIRMIQNINTLISEVDFSHHFYFVNSFFPLTFLKGAFLHSQILFHHFLINNINNSFFQIFLYSYHWRKQS